VPKVDVNKALTKGLEIGPFNPERVGHSKNGAGRIVVKAEPRMNDFSGMPPRPDPREVRPAASIARARLRPAPAPGRRPSHPPPTSTTSTRPRPTKRWRRASTTSRKSTTRTTRTRRRAARSMS